MSKPLVTSEPVCKDSEFKLNKETCLCEKKKTKKLKSKLKLVEKFTSPEPQAPPPTIDEFLNKTIINKDQFQNIILNTLNNKKPQSSTKTKKKQKPCPKGKRRNPKTNRCVKSENLKKINKAKKKAPTVKSKLVKELEKIPEQTIISLKPTKRKRCPKGTRKNKKTGNCDKVEDSKKDPVFIIPSNTSQSQTILGNKIMIFHKKELTNIDKEKKISESIKSFSPTINKKLVTKIKGEPKGQSLMLMDKKCFSTSELSQNKKLSEPSIFVNGRCVRYFASEAQKALLKNLAYSRKSLAMEDVTAPKQEKSNCWFNTMFMVFFVSNKGRKFFKFFRQLMIEGKRDDGRPITPPRLRLSFAYLNLAIESSLTPALTDVDNLDTNNIISLIFKGIPVQERRRAIKNVGKANNPLAYYKAIMDYLNTDEVSLITIRIGLDTGVNDIPNSQVEGTQKYMEYIEREFNLSLEARLSPEIIVIEIGDKASKSIMKNISGLLKPSKLGSEQYVLDSAIVRDTEKRHFCSVLEIGKKQCGFDGASFRKLSEFKWKTLINSDKNWTFEGSDWDGTSESINWNFRNGYQLLFYYRI